MIKRKIDIVGQALRGMDFTDTKPPVLLIDEVDRADEEFEAYLLEVLSDFQISIPEIGTIEATSIPYVVLTSNGTRELSDALRRRCLYHYVEYPSEDKELRIVMARLPEAGVNLGMISTSEIKISVVVDEKYLELGVRALHKAFQLEQAK